MKLCHRCARPITGEAEEITPFSVSGARPTLWRHTSQAECERARQASGTVYRSCGRP
ncbi:hypothetical protein [Streptomyces sp. CC208A]|uniref:hypothetical protein n=1 Tax=Streptomyces sp. CC208A TaxID=3044573 RepID=UPI0024A9D1AC|nr:hypothetical protein [Streptomyces sp. CC208A]